MKKLFLIFLLFLLSCNSSRHIKIDVPRWKLTNIVDGIKYEKPSASLPIELWRYVKDYIDYKSDNTTEDQWAPMSTIMESPRHDCEEYACFLAVLLDLSNYDVEVVVGDTSGDGKLDHAWVEMKYDNRIYWLNPVAPPPNSLEERRPEIYVGYKGWKIMERVTVPSLQP